MNIKYKVFYLLLLMNSSLLFAQCNVVSDSSGIITDTISSNTISYNVTTSGAATYASFSQSNLCGFNFPNINAPWSGNTNAIGTVTYTFSMPITTIKVIVALAGVNTQVHPESFIFTTENGAPTLSVDSGSCSPWIVTSNEITSPPVLDALSSIVTITSLTPFSTLNIISGDSSNLNGGSIYGLCDVSPVTKIDVLKKEQSTLKLFPNPNNGRFKVELNQETTGKSYLEVCDALGRVLIFYSLQGALNQKSIDLTNFEKGVYYLRVFDDNSSQTKRIVVQ